MAGSAYKINAKLDVTSVIKCDRSRPIMEVMFGNTLVRISLISVVVDGTKKKFDTARYKAADIAAELDGITGNIENKLIKEGKLDM